ncbi:hypothetical protein BLA29_008583 [Euroglyphus maynei]|uniref:Uncharacterized protein n=1 Tax=Euroglyphus maynei TaxID=6958 RepID=A0A1Y3BEP2_EURMA|nr:hypothetical protein BLA29_008583 [Euroglyphus maynei]
MSIYSATQTNRKNLVQLNRFPPKYIEYINEFDSYEKNIIHHTNITTRLGVLTLVVIFTYIHWIECRGLTSLDPELDNNGLILKNGPDSLIPMSSEMGNVLASPNKNGYMLDGYGKKKKKKKKYKKKKKKYKKKKKKKKYKKKKKKKYKKKKKKKKYKKKKKKY